MFATEVVSRQVSVLDEVKPFLWDCQDLWSRSCGTHGVPLRATALSWSSILCITATTGNVPRLPTLTKSVIKPVDISLSWRMTAHAHMYSALRTSPRPTLIARCPGSCLPLSSGPGRQSHQGGQSFAIPVAEFGKVSHQGCRG